MFGMTGQHYQLFCDALLAIVQAFCAGAWSEQGRAAWERALDVIAAAMTAGAGTPVAEAALAHLPPWTGDIVVSGPRAMVARTVALATAAVPSARLHADHLPSVPRPL